MNRKYVKPPYHARVVSTPETEYWLIEQEYLRRPLGSRERAVGRVPEAVRDMELDALLAALRQRGLRAVRWPGDAVASPGDDQERGVA